MDRRQIDAEDEAGVILYISALEVILNLGLSWLMSRIIYISLDSQVV